MNWPRRLRGFLRTTFRPAAIAREVDADLAFHLAERVDDLVSRGVPPEAAERQARHELGDPAKWRQDAREARGAGYVDDLRTDLAYALRWLRRSPVFTTAAIMSLAIGIGANAAIFNLIDVVLLRPLPVSHPDELAIPVMTGPNGENSHGFSYPMFRAFNQSRTLSGLAAMTPIRVSLDSDGAASATASGQLVSGSYYGVLGVRAAIGRTLLATDDGAPGSGDVAVLSYGFWQRRYGGDPAVVGRRIAINGVGFTVVGVSAKGFSGTHVGESTDVTVPLSMWPSLAGPGDALRLTPMDGEFWLELVGRRRAGVTNEQVRHELSAIFQPLFNEWFVDSKAKAFGRHHLEIESGSRGESDLRRRFSRPLWLLMAAVGLVLLIACANVANLLLARAAVRRREMAVRIALGATRARLVRQLVAESLLLAGVGALGGLLLTTWTSAFLASILTGDEGRLAAHPDSRVLAFTCCIALVSGVIFGLIPAAAASRLNTGATLKDGDRGSASGGLRFGLRNLLVMIQVAVSVVLLVCASLFVRTLWNLRTIDLGMDQEHVLMLRLEPLGSNQKRLIEPRLRAVYGRIVRGIQRLPGVRAVSLTGTTPLSDENQFGSSLKVDGYAPGAGEDMHVRFIQVYPGFLDALGVHLIAGRDLQPEDDRPDAPLRAVVNGAMATRFFGGAAAAIGRGLTLPNGSHVEIVGVSADSRDRAIRDAPEPRVLMTFARAGTGRGQMTLLVRAAGDPRGLISSVRELAHEADPSMPLFAVQTIADRVAAQTRQQQLVALLTTLFGAVAALLAAIGLYGVVAYAVTSRRTELGVRLALGATPGGVRRLVLGDSLFQVALGLIAGVGISAGVSRWISQMLFGVGPFDPTSFAMAASLLVIVATIAAWVPARQAARIDPATVLRQA